jgi:opacity protein-like surface antigen
MKNSKIKTFIFASTLMVTGTANAKESYFSGPYAGVGVSYLSDKSVKHYNIGDGTQFSDERFAKKDSTGTSGSLQAGYGHIFFDRLYTALEAKFSYLNEYNIQNYKQIPALVTRLKYNHAYHVSVRLGHVFYENHLVYLKGGYVNTDVTINAEAGGEVRQQGSKKTKSLGGYEVGLGFTTRVSDKLNLGLEVSKTVVDKYKYTSISSEDSVYTTDGTVKPRLLSVSLSLNYQF